MSDLEDIKTSIKKKPKRYLLGVNFDFEADENNPFGPHLALTTGMGAASGMNEAYLFKSIDHKYNENHKHNTDCKHNTNHNTNGAGVDDIDGDKVITSPTINKAECDSKDTPASLKNETLENEMDEKVLKELKAELDSIKAERDELNKKLKAKDITKNLDKYSFAEDILKGISDVMVDLADEQVSIIEKAFDFISATVKEDVQKSIDKDKAEDNPLKKALEDEVGDSQTTEEPLSKSLKDRIAEAKEKYNI